MDRGVAVTRARRWHLWLALIVGIQAAIWAISGLYMTAIDIETIHGDHLVRTDAPETVRMDTVRVEVEDLRRRFGILTGLRLGSAGGRDFLVVDHRQGRAVLDPATGQELAPIGVDDARRIATSLYTGDHAIANAALLDEVPAEIRGRAAPVWRVEFDHWNKPTLYLSPATGELLSRRHELWRVFDFLWMLHIMDYETREDVNNLLLRIATVAGVLLSLVGLVLLVLRLWRGRPGEKTGAEGAA